MRHEQRPDQLAQAAIRRIKAKRNFKTHVVVYLVVNLVLVGIWAISGAGFFQPVFSILFWGMGLLFDGWGAYYGASRSPRRDPGEMGGDGR
ncbi:MAG: 2TM domain-containing protein [Microthrixaceae bacterium]